MIFKLSLDRVYEKYKVAILRRGRTLEVNKVNAVFLEKFQHKAVYRKGVL